MWQKLERIMDDSIAEGFPSAQIIVEHEGRLVKNSAYGYALRQPKTILATQETLYDIASLTKIFSLTYGFQYLVDRDPTLLDQTLYDLLGAQVPSEKRAITLEMLLAHAAGFEANPLFYDRNYSEALYCQDRDRFLHKLLAAPLIAPPNQQILYSDVDYMLLTFLFERLVGRRLDKWLAKIFWQPLGLQSIGYRPLEFIPKERIAGTELMGNRRDGAIDFDNIRRNTIWGEVQDEKAYHCMAGISGHAGLFANGKSLRALLQLMYDKSGFFSETVKQRFLASHLLDCSFGLGWRLNRREGLEFMFGDYASSAAYGHTGWTGCVMMHDPTYALTIIYLTNRKHTAVVDPAEDSNRFYGDLLPAGRYRPIINEIYETLGLQS